MGVASGCGEQEVGVVVRYIDFLIPTPLVSVLFCSSIPIFFHFLNVFRSCFSTFW